MKKRQEISEKGKQLFVRMLMKTLHFVAGVDRDAGKILQKTPDCMTSMLKRRTLPPPQIDEKKCDAWKESRKPGDPIPEEYRQHEKARCSGFPAII